MEDFILTATERIPEIRLEPGYIGIKGHSIPQDPKETYRPVLQWVRDYVKEPLPVTEVSICIDFSDTGSTKAIYDILKLLAICQNSNQEIKIDFNWIFKKDDNDIRELGEFLASKLGIVFNYSEE